MTQINKERLPKHIAVIMDGNGRWAKEKGQDRLYGHFHGVESVRSIVEGSAELGIGYLTLYAFSTENWDIRNYPDLPFQEDEACIFLRSGRHKDHEKKHPNQFLHKVCNDIP